MNKRDRVRYTSDLLPNSFKTIFISWDNNSPIKASALNYCSHGIKISFPSFLSPIDIPQKNSTIKVQMPIKLNWITGKCITSTIEQDDSVTLGIYFNNPAEQSNFQNLLYNSLENQRHPNSFVSYEWEELVENLCNSDDPYLRSVGFSKKGDMTDMEETS
jgi:hypothetical protein